MKGILKSPLLLKNEIFLLEAKYNRDNANYPYNILRKNFEKHGITLSTMDQINGLPDFEIHFNVQNKSKSEWNYLLLLENELIDINNKKIPAFYRKIFTWNDELVDGHKYIKICLPNKFEYPQINGYLDRDIFCTMIASNKTTHKFTFNELYSERVEIIKWFEKNNFNNFKLYGSGWDMPAPIISGPLGQLSLKFFKIINTNLKFQTKRFHSWCGQIKSKNEILRRSRFSICYENVSYPGYITEKIFDSFFSGCIPVYWGASNINNYINTNCFIDRRVFSNNDELFLYLKSLTEFDYLRYQVNITNYLRGPQAKKFEAESFAHIVTNSIIKDLFK